MLARFDEAVNVDAWLEMYAAVARLAVLDYQRGPLVCGEKHYQTACRFLEESGLISRLPPPPAPAGPRQLALFDGETR